MNETDLELLMNKIEYNMSKKQKPPPNRGFLNKTRPKYTYTHKKIEAIIKNLDQKHNYGKLSNSDINRRLR